MPTITLPLPRGPASLTPSETKHKAPFSPLQVTDPSNHLRPFRPNGPRYEKQFISTPPACETCPLRLKTKVYPDGPVPAKIAFVGEAPGKHEVRKGRPFVGASGHVMWKIFGDVLGLRREDVWVTNALLCRPSKITLQNGVVIPEEQVKQLAMNACRMRLIDELRVVDPVVTIPLGKWSLRALTFLPNAGIYAYRGSRMEIDYAAMSDYIHGR